MKKQNYLFHPYEIIFSGYSGSGKTTLIEKLMKKYSKDNNVAFIKHDIHKFDMDKKGKDTYRISNAGAKSVFISSENGSAYLTKNGVDKYHFKSELSRYDFTVIEGYKNEEINKYFITTIEKIKNIDFTLSKYNNLLAIIIDKKLTLTNLTLLNKSLEGRVGVVFYRDDIENIYNHSITYLKEKTQKIKLNALVLVGGKSKRMGRDKSAINYNGKPQAQYLYEILKPLVNKVLISSREEQNKDQHLLGLDYVNDIISDIGPLGGIISAMLTDRNSAWLVVACDLPYITEKTIKKLIENRDYFKIMTTFKGERGFEPLISIYEPKAFNSLINGITFNQYSIRRLLKTFEKKYLTIENKELINVNKKSDLETISQIKIT